MQLESLTKKQLIKLIEEQKNANFAERKFYIKKLDAIEDFLRFEFSGENEWVKTRILNIIHG